MSLRQISLYDVDMICELLVELRRASPEYAFVREDWTHVPPRLQHMICQPTFIGVIDEDFRGFMFGSIEEHWYSSRIDAFEQLLYVAEEWRGGMLAVRLIKGFEAEARRRGAENIYAGATTGMQEGRTIELYKKLGYRTTLPAVRKEL